MRRGSQLQLQGREGLGSVCGVGDPGKSGCTCEQERVHKFPEVNTKTGGREGERRQKEGKPPSPNFGIMCGFVLLSDAV